MNFLILVIIAVAMILFVTNFGAGIFNAFFPSEDKSTLKSFESLYQTIEAKSYSNKPYDSTTMGVYLKDDYRIILFDESPTGFCGKFTATNQFRVAKPKECAQNKPCLCLVKKIDISHSAISIQSDILSCKNFKNSFSVNPDYLQINQQDCKAYTGKYHSFIIAKKTDGDKSYIYILDDNEANRKQDAAWKIPACTTTDNKNPCFEKLSGAIVPDKVDETVYEACDAIDHAFNTLQAKCVYDETAKDCILKCGETPIDCEKDCYDFNSEGPDSGFKYMRGNTWDSLQCINHNKYCPESSGCVKSNIGMYVFSSTQFEKGTGEVSTTMQNLLLGNLVTLDTEGMNQQLYDNIKPDLNKKVFDLCSAQVWKIIIDSAEYTFLVGFDDKKVLYTKTTGAVTCNDYFTQRPGFRQVANILTCKDTSDHKQCNNLIDDKRSECNIYYIGKDNRMITYYDASKPDCVKAIEDLFEPIYTCEDAPAQATPP